MKKYYYKRNYYPSSTELGDIGFTYEILGTKPIRLCPYVFGDSIYWQENNDDIDKPSPELLFGFLKNYPNLESALISYKINERKNKLNKI